MRCSGAADEPEEGNRVIQMLRYCLRDREIRHLVVWNAVGLAFLSALFWITRGPSGLLLAPIPLLFEWAALWFVSRRSTEP